MNIMILMLKKLILKNRDMIQKDLKNLIYFFTQNKVLYKTKIIINIKVSELINLYCIKYLNFDLLNI